METFELREEVTRFLAMRGDHSATEISGDKVLVFLNVGTYVAKVDDSGDIIMLPLSGAKDALHKVTL